MKYLVFPGSSAGKESACNVGDPCSIPGSGRSPGEGIDYPLQWIFLTQESNRGLLHSRQILYQLSYQGRSIGGTRVKGVSVPGSML